jgi:hypothetical protein
VKKLSVMASGSVMFYQPPAYLPKNRLDWFPAQLAPHVGAMRVHGQSSRCRDLHLEMCTRKFFVTFAIPLHYTLSNLFLKHADWCALELLFLLN